MPYINAYNIIPNHQYSYKKNIGIHNIHTDIQRLILSSFNDKDYIEIDIIFLDLSDAFDSICHNKLLEKLKRSGITGKFLDIITDTFVNRRQEVKYNNVFSEDFNVVSGCLQGGILSPTLFNIYTSDMPKCVESHLFSYADDTVIIRQIFSESDCQILQNDLIKIENYCKMNYLKLNSTKTKCMRISLKQTKPFNYSITSKPIENTVIQKHVGVFL